MLIAEQNQLPLCLPEDEWPVLGTKRKCGRMAGPSKGSVATKRPIEDHAEPHPDSINVPHKRQRTAKTDAQQPNDM